MIHVKNLNYEYPGVLALKDISFSISAGSITALVGPNGAGKTTLLRCLAGLDEPINGYIEIDGVDVLEHPRASHRHIGYLSDFFGLYDVLTVRQSLQFAGESAGIDRNIIEERIIATAKDLDLSDRLNTQVKNLSRGLKQRVGIGQAIIHLPKVLLLDEPAAGLDPGARHALSDLFIRLRQRGMTLIVSSHILAELKEYSSDMLIISEGKVVEHKLLDHPENGARLRIEWTEIIEDLPEKLMQLENVTLVETKGLTSIINFTGDRVARNALLKRMFDIGLPVSGLYEAELDLQDYYISRVQKGSPKDGDK